MFGKLFTPKQPSAEQMVFDLITQIRAKHGHNVRHPLPASFGRDPKFVGALLGMMDVLSTKTGEESFLISNTRHLFQKLFGLTPGTDEWSDGMKAALRLMETGSENDVVIDSIEEVEECMLNSKDVERDLYAIISRFF